MAYNPLFHRILTDVVMGSDIESTPIEVQNQDNLGISVSWTGDAVGTFSALVSIDYSVDSFGNVVNPGTWTALPLDPVIAAAGADDNAIMDLNQIPALYLKLAYARTSGTGVLNAYVSGKAV